MARTTWRSKGKERGRPQDRPPLAAHAMRRSATLLTVALLVGAVAVAAPATSAGAEAGVPDAVRFTVEPASIIAGEAFEAPPELVLVDDGDTPVPVDPDVQYRFALFAVDGSGVPIPLSCSVADLTAVDASPERGFTTALDTGTSASFDGCTTTVGGDGHQLVGVAVAADGTVYSTFSAPFEVSAAAPDRLSFARQPIGATGGATELTQQPMVAIHDAYGNLVAGDDATEVTLALTSDDATLTCATNPRAASSGQAAFSGCSVDAPGVYTLTASAAELRPVTSAEFVVSAGAAAVLEFSSQPLGAPGGAPLATQPVVSVVDAAGNPVAATVSLALAGDTAATLTCAANPVAAPDGAAAFSACAVDRAGAYSLVATVVGTDVTATSDEFTIASGAADRAVFAASPSIELANAPFGTQPVVHLVDAGGNLVADAGGEVRLALAGDGTAGALTCAANPVTVENGVATFEGCRISASGTAYRLTAVTAVGVVVSAPLTVASGEPAGLAFESIASTYQPGSLLSAQPRVVVVDAVGNHLAVPPPADVALAVSGGALDCDDFTHTDDFGATTFSGCVITGTGPVSITATSGDLAAATAELARAALPPVGTGTPASLPLGQTFGGQLWANNPSSVVNDVNEATGGVQRSTTDLTVAGIGLPFTLTRAYHSRDVAGGLFGPGWSSILDAGVSLSADLATATLRGEDGQRVVFARGSSCKNANAPCRYVGPVGARAELSCQRQRCTATRFDGVTLESEEGRTTRLTAPGGHGLTFTYQAGVLRSVRLRTAGAPLAVDVTVVNGRITRLATPTRAVVYAYDGLGRLSEYTDAAGATTTYAYDDDSRLTTVTDPLGAVRFRVTYGADGRVATAAATGGPRRFSDHYSWDEVSRTSTRRADVTAYGEPTHAVHRTRIAGHVVLWQQQPHGGTTAYAYDGQLNLTIIQDAAGGRHSMTYSPAGDLLTSTAPDGGVSRFAYDSEHRIVEATDPNGNVRQTTSVQGLVAWEIPPDPGGAANRPGPRGRVGTHFVRDEWGLVTEEQTPTSRRRYEYDTAGNVTGLRVFLRDGNTAVNGAGPLMSYDEAGNLLRTVMPRGRNGTSIDEDYATTSTYDAVGRRLSVAPAGRGATATDYDVAGDVVSIQQPDTSQPTTFEWDESSLTMTETTGTTTVVRTYDASGQLLRTDDGRGHATTYVFDLSGRLVAETDPAGITTTYRYDAAGRVTSLADDAGVAATFEHDALYRVVSTSFRGASETTEFDFAGNVIGAKAADGVRTTYRYDNHGRLVSTTDAAGTTTYHYDLDGNLTGVTDGNGHRTTYTNDAAGRRTSMVVGGRMWTYGYDVDSNLVTVADPAGRTTIYTRSPAGDATQIEHRQSGQATITVTQQFDGQGRRTTMTDAAGTHDFDYDLAGNLVSATGPGAGFSFDYSAAGRMTATYPDGIGVTYRLDDAGNVMELDAPGVSVAYLRDRARRVTGIAFGNGVLETRGYDAAGRLVSQSLTCGGTPVGAIRYGYDGNGNPLAEESTIGGETARNGYAYDATGRVVASDWSFTPPRAPSGGCTTEPAGPGTPVGSDGSGLPDEPPAQPTDVFVPDAGPGLGPVAPATANPLVYDAVGNRVSGPLGGAGYNGRDELVSGSAGSAVYDAAGNLVSSTVDGATTSYGYDAAGRLSRVTTPNGRVITYGYDGDGNRLTKAIDGDLVARYFWDPSGDVPLLALEEDASGELLRRYFYGVGPVAFQVPGRAAGEVDTYYYVTNARGDVRALTDDTGAVVATYSYGPFGEVLDSTGDVAALAENPLLFQGEVFDGDTGLYNLRARNYDPRTGRFTQRDPVVPAPARPSVSPYAFADNQPTVAGDPTGRIPNPRSLLRGHSTESANDVNESAFWLKVTNLALTHKLKGTNPLLAKGFGNQLSVAGLALGAYVVAQDCQHGPVERCVAGVVGVSISAFCLMATQGAGSIVCNLTGVALSFVISSYGPLIAATVVEGVMTSYDVAAREIVGAANVAADALELAGEAVARAFEEAGAAIADGFNSLGGAISSGYRQAISTLADAGYSAVQLAKVLGEQFVQGVETAIAELIALGYHATAIADALEEAFDRTAEQAAALMKQVGYAIEQITAGLSAAYSFTIDAAAAALAALGYAWDEIAKALVDAYGATVQAVTAALRAIGATAADVADALVSAFNATGEAVALALHAAGYALGEIASAVSDVVGMTAEAFAAISRGLNYTAAVIADALRSGFDATADVAAGALKAAGFVVDQVSAALRDAYHAGAAAVASALADAGYLVTQIAGTLEHVFHASTEAITGFLTSAGFSAEAINSIGGAFQSAWNTVANEVASWFGF